MVYFIRGPILLDHCHIEFKNCGPLWIIWNLIESQTKSVQSSEPSFVAVENNSIYETWRFSFLGAGKNENKM